MHPAIANHKYITIRPLAKPPQLLQASNGTKFLILGPLKVLFQSWSLYKTMGLGTEPAKWLIVQVLFYSFESRSLRQLEQKADFEKNPPSIPTLMVASLVAFLRKTRLVIDWHNLGYSVLGLKLGPNHPMVVASRLYERWFSRFAAVNFTVSDAMRRQLKRDFGVEAPLLRLYDRPTADFQPASSEDRLEFLKDMELPRPQQALLEKGMLKVLVSSTSWTVDEDFSILLDALVGYSDLATSKHPKLPELLVVITGKGPQKERYLKEIDALEKKGKLEMVSIKTAWLPTAAYAMLLASADLGICLHKSSSGVDLPMKVVDMFGAGLPVAGWSLYESWPELVKEGVNGKGFGNSEELEQILLQLFGDDGSKLSALREGALIEGQRRWDDEWNECAGKIFELGQQN